MNIIIGHSSMDLDCISSIVLAKYLYPDYIPVRSGLIHPAAKNLFNLYKDRLTFLSPPDLKGHKIENILVVDTRASDKIEEYLKYIDFPDVRIEVYDHHPSDGRDIPNAVIHECSYGSNTAFLCQKLMEKGFRVDAEDATIALTGIYSDTGNFLHPNVCGEDFSAASFLISLGASLSLVKEFLFTLREKHQITLFHEILTTLETKIIQGHEIKTCFLEVEEETLGLGAVVEKAFEVENCDILFGFFSFARKGKLLIIARNKIQEVCLNEILSDFGGGGHSAAAAATVKTDNPRVLSERILGYLDQALAPALTAGDIMTKNVRTLDPDMSMLEASLVLEEINHTGAPVLDSESEIVGVLTLRDIMKGRRAGQMKSPVKTFMSKKVIAADPNTTIKEIEALLFQNSIGHLPVVDKGKLEGIVTRTDFLDHMRGEKEKKNRVLENLGVMPDGNSVGYFGRETRSPITAP